MQLHVPINIQSSLNTIQHFSKKYKINKSRKYFKIVYIHIKLFTESLKLNNKTELFNYQRNSVFDSNDENKMIQTKYQQVPFGWKNLTAMSWSSWCHWPSSSTTIREWTSRWWERECKCEVRWCPVNELTTRSCPRECTWNACSASRERSPLRAWTLSRVSGR